MAAAAPTFHAFLVDRRAHLVEGFVAGLLERIPFYRGQSKEDLLPGAARYMDAVLSAVASGDPAPAIESVAESIAVRASQGLRSEEALDIAALTRGLVIDLALEGVFAGVPGAVEGLRFLERISDAVVRRIASFYEAKLVAAERAVHLIEERSSRRSCRSARGRSSCRWSARWTPRAPSRCSPCSSTASSPTPLASRSST